jgi:hypothetical protein
MESGVAMTGIWPLFFPHKTGRRRKMGVTWYLVKPDKSEVFELGDGEFRKGFPFCTTDEKGWIQDGGPLLVNWTTVYTCLSNWCFIWPGKHAEQSAEFAKFAIALAWRVREWVGVGKTAYLCHENDVMGLSYEETKSRITGSVYDDHDYSFESVKEVLREACKPLVGRRLGLEVSMEELIDALEPSLREMLCAHPVPFEVTAGPAEDKGEMYVGITAYYKDATTNEETDTIRERDRLFAEKPRVLIDHNNEAGEVLWSVVFADADSGKAGFWLDSFGTLEEAQEFCKQHELFSDYDAQTLEVFDSLEGGTCE